MREIVKICGLSTPEAVDAVVSGGATHLGFIFFEKSPRNLPVKLARALIDGLKNLRAVAVTVDAKDAMLDEIVQTMQPDLLQLHGNETLKRVADVKSRYGLPVIKAIAVRSDDDIARAKTYDGVADYLLLDAKPPEGSDLPGGNGVSFDWTLVGGFQTTTPVLLSGGLDISNLSEALQLIDSDKNSFIGLDVSSGVESAPGVKDISKIEEFLAACQ